MGTKSYEESHWMWKGDKTKCNTQITVVCKGLGSI